MSENQEQAPVEQTQQPVAAGVDFSAQVELLKAKNQELIAEKQKVKANFEDLQKLEDKKYCDQLTILTSQIIKDKLTNAQWDNLSDKSKSLFSL